MVNTMQSYIQCFNAVPKHDRQTHRRIDGFARNTCYESNEEPLVVRCFLTTHLQLFGHTARSSPREDHHRALAAAIRQVPLDWKQQIGRPSHTWLREIEADLGPLNFGLTTAWRKINDDILWTQQRSSGVRYERRRKE